jgi:hypothetical protein
VPCLEEYDAKGHPECGTDCDLGSISFINDREFFGASYCIEAGVDYSYGTYQVLDNHLILDFNKPIYNVPEAIGDDTIPPPPNMRMRDKTYKMILEIHFWYNKPIFLSALSSGPFGSIPSPMKPIINDEEKNIIEKLKKR